MNSKINILLIGRGGRESAMAWKILQSPRIDTLYIAPGTFPGAIYATGLDTDDPRSVTDFVERHSIDMVVVGPTEYIVAGLADDLREAGITVVAPSKEVARLEASKEYAKDFMSEYIIPTPRCMAVTTETVDEGLAFMESRRPPYVLKADGLAQGLGVVILDGMADAKDTLADMLEGHFGEASHTVIIEDYVKGPECSVMIATDGTNYQMFPAVHDYKRLYDGDKGPNTAGMGGYAPVDWADGEFMAKVERRIIAPTLSALRENGTPYCGFLYFGIVSDCGEPILLEYNVRLGDPEAQVVLPLMEGDMVDLLEDMATGHVGDHPLKLLPLASVAVVVAGPGYPSDDARPEPVRGIDEARDAECLVFPGDIVKDATGRIVTPGGRALTVEATAGNLPVASDMAREGAAAIELDGKQYRSDIGTPINRDE